MTNNAPDQLYDDVTERNFGLVLSFYANDGSEERENFVGKIRAINSPYAAQKC